jgi:hypothetical protein
VISPITGFQGKPAFKIGDYQYWYDGTLSLYGEGVDQSGMVGGTGDRTPAHTGRLGLIPHKATVLDYGCGNGEFVEFLRTHGIYAEGFDPYSTTWSTRPQGLFDVIFMIEVIEHTTAPFSELDTIKSLLSPAGQLFIETSFSDWVTPDHPYANPKIGHNTIFSHLGLDYLMISKGFTPGPHVNRNIRCYTL